MKFKIKLIISIMILLILAILMPIKERVKAVDSINIDSGTGITIESDNVKEGESTHKVKITVDNTGMNYPIKAFNLSIDIWGFLKNGEPDINILTDNWTISEDAKNYHVQSNLSTINFIVEVVDDSLNNNDNYDIEIELVFNVSSSNGDTSNINVQKFQRTDAYNNVTELEDTLSLTLIREETTDIPENPITVKDEYKDQITIVGQDIFVKMDYGISGNHSLYTFANALEYDGEIFEDLKYFFWDKNKSNVTIPTLISDGWKEKNYGDFENYEIGTGTLWLALYSESSFSLDTSSYYNVYVIGDCELGNNSSYDDKVNIEDVVYLRRAIVLDSELDNEGDFVMETTDTNWSNGKPESPGLGDIGDVIAIRRRVLNKYWDDLKTDSMPTVTTPPTTPVTENTKYQDKNGDIAVIPEGFRVSSDSDEQTINGNYDEGTHGGLVVIAKDGSEFVWIPVEDASTMYGIDSDGNYLGKLYEDGDLSSPLNWTESGGVMKWTLTSGSESNREPALLSSYDTDSQYYSDIAGFTNQTQFENSMKNKFEEMVKSVDQYGGFYIGRYETSFGRSTNGVTKAQSVKNVESMTADSDSANTWYGLYKYHSSYSEFLGEVDVLPEVGSSMIYGSQYDQMMIWLNSNEIDVTSATPNGASRNTSRITGSRDNDKLNNIYDLLGNSFEWTLEANYTNRRVLRRRRLQQQPFTSLPQPLQSVQYQFQLFVSHYTLC